MTSARMQLERIWRWRQAAVWAPVLWFPALIYALLSERMGLALTLGLGGLVFAALVRMIVWLARCPECQARWGASRAGFQRLWDQASCLECGLSLFELRRRSAGAVQRGGKAEP